MRRFPIENIKRTIAMTFSSVALAITAAVAVAETTWEPAQLPAFTATQPHAWSDFPLRVEFIHAGGGEKIAVDGFWNGGNRWLVRYALPREGQWNWTAISNDPGLTGSGSIHATAPAAKQIENNRNYRGHVQVGPNRRYFVHADGTPFFYIGDTLWKLSSLRAGVKGDRNFYRWADDRTAKKFSVVQTAGFWSEANEGGMPFANNDWSALNPAHFAYTDTRFRYLWYRGFAIAMNTSWVTRSDMDLQQASNIARYLYARYGAYNLVWGVSGEFNHDKAEAYWIKDNYARVRRLGNEIKRFNDAAYRHPTSIHPAAGPWISSGPYSSHYLMHREPWLDHNWLQTYSLTERIPHEVHAAYNAAPTKPVVQAEPCYEGSATHPYQERCSAYLVRWQAWTALLQGAAGHVYGSEGIYFMDNPNAVQDPGSSHMSVLSAFLRGLSWWELDPAIDCVTVNGIRPSLDPDADTRLQTRHHPRCAGKVGAFYVAYIPAGNNTNRIALRNLAERAYTARWFNPRTGKTTAIRNGPVHAKSWQAPPPPDDNDWVLLVRAVR